MADVPRGTVTFLFTDIAGSTARWQRDRSAMAAAVERHLALLDAAIQHHGSVHFKSVDDAVQAAIPTVPQAVAAAVAGQRTLLTEDLPGEPQLTPVTVLRLTAAASGRGARSRAAASYSCRLSGGNGAASGVIIVVSRGRCSIGYLI
jgi:class 3 adenylate cyclase